MPLRLSELREPGLFALSERMRTSPAGTRTGDAAWTMGDLGTWPGGRRIASRGEGVMFSCELRAMTILGGSAAVACSVLSSVVGETGSAVAASADRSAGSLAALRSLSLKLWAAALVLAESIESVLALHWRTIAAGRGLGDE